MHADATARRFGMVNIRNKTNKKNRQPAAGECMFIRKSAVMISFEWWDG
jgi:nucleoid DNA-binding protein